MKRNILPLFAAMVAAVFTACGDDDNEKWNTEAPIYIRGVDKVNKNLHWNVEGNLTAHEICKLDSLLTIGGTYSLANGRLDTINDRLIMIAGNINDYRENDFIDVERNPDLVITRWWYDGGDPMVSQQLLGTDTIAYIPNQQRADAYEKIKALWDKEAWNEIYEIFQNAFTFVPCTGKEFKELKEKGLN